MINFKNLQKSFQSAFNGLLIAFREEQTFKIQSGLGLIVLFLAFLLPLRGWERVVLILLIILVLGMELINSQIEKLQQIEDLESRLKNVVESLPQQCRYIFYLSRYKQMAYKEIARSQAGRKNT